jgi:hypothetical protein
LKVDTIFRQRNSAASTAQRAEGAMQQIHLSIQDLNHIVITEIGRGKSREDMVTYLRDRGWPEDNARKFISNALGQKTYQEYTAQEAAREAEQDDPFIIDDEKQKMQYAWVVAAIGLTMIALSAVNTLINIGR